MIDVDAFKEHVLRDALEITASPNTPRSERGMAARIAAECISYIEWDERRCADVLRALRGCLDVESDAFTAVEALLDVVRRRESVRPEKVAVALGRLASRALERGKMMSLHTVLLMLLDHDVWSALVSEECVEAAVRWALGRAIQTRDPAGEILHFALPRLGFDRPWLRNVVRDHPDVIRSIWFDTPTKVMLHALAPSAENWIYLIDFKDDEALVDLEVEPFKRGIIETIATLQEALIAVGGEGARAVVLANWMSRLILPA